MRMLFVLLLIIIAFDFTQASSTRLQGLSAPVWSLQDDTESIDLSPAFITRLNGSELLLNLGFSFFDNSISNAIFYNTTNSLYFKRSYNNTINGRFAYLSMLSNFGYGIILTPNINFNGSDELHRYSAGGSDDLIENAINLNLTALSVILGYKLLDHVSIGIKPNITYNLNISTTSNYINNVLISDDVRFRQTYNYSFGSDFGLNFTFGNVIFGLIENISIYPRQIDTDYQYQSFIINSGIIGEIGSFKYTIEFLYSTSSNDNQPQYNSIQPSFGISYHFTVFNSVFVISGLHFSYYNILSASQYGYTVDCFAGIESRFNEFLTARFSLNFDPFKWEYTSYPYSDYTFSYINNSIFGNWELSSGLSFYPISNLSIDLLWSITYFNLGWSNNITEFSDYSGYRSIHASPAFNFISSISVTYKI